AGIGSCLATGRPDCAVDARLPQGSTGREGDPFHADQPLWANRLRLAADPPMPEANLDDEQDEPGQQSRKARRPGQYEDEDEGDDEEHESSLRAGGASQPSSERWPSITGGVPAACLR